MREPEDGDFVCSECNNDIRADDDFCPHCGAMLIDGVMCDLHRSAPAAGVCIICALPFCHECGLTVFGRFLCNRHRGEEIYEGMVRVYGVLDDVAAQYVKACLEQAGLHPLLYCRGQPRGGPRFVYTLYASAGDYDGHVVNEIKVMVPCQEATAAAGILADLKIVGGASPGS
jgi:hypothetical protein